MSRGGQEEDFDFLFKIVLIGDSGVGKTNILSRFSKNEFNLESKPTIGVEFATKTMNVGNKVVKAQIWDTAGQERFNKFNLEQKRYRAITNAYYRGAVGALVCFDITRQQTFENTTKWMNELKEHGDPTITVVMLGNKSDLQDKRAVRAEDAQALCEQKEVAYIETSALQSTNINLAFEKILAQIYSKIGKKLEADIKAKMESDKITLDDTNEKSQVKEKDGCC